jgi:hypothetical protein
VAAVAALVAVPMLKSSVCASWLVLGAGVTLFLLCVLSYGKIIGALFRL